jgi:hypothetical protein
MFFRKLIEISGNIKIVDEVKLNISIGKRVWALHTCYNWLVFRAPFINPMNSNRGRKTGRRPAHAAVVGKLLSLWRHMRHVQCLSQDKLLRHVPCCFYLHPEDTSDAMTRGAMAGCRTCTVHHIVSVVGRSNPGDAWSTVSLHQEDRTTNQSAHTPCARPTPTAKKMGQRNGLACSGK